MRTNILGWLVTIVLTFGCLQADAAVPAGIRNPDQIVFEGAKQVAEKDVCAALTKDFDAILAVHPDASLSGYLRAIETTAQLGYRHSGFNQAKIKAEYNEPKEKIVVHIEEGPRFFCGDIVITGAKQVDAAQLADSLREPAKQDKTPWVPGRPVRFDPPAMTSLINRIKESFSAQGFAHARFDFRTSAESGESTQKLEIIIKDEGPRAEVGKITIAGNERDSDSDILNYLDLRPGQRYDSGLANRLEDLFKESGRFLGSHISRAGPQQIIEDREIVDLNIEIRDYEPSSALASAFSPQEKAMLALRDWADRWARGETDHDFIFEVSVGTAELEQMCADMEWPMPSVESTGVSRVDARMVLSAKQGQVVTLRLWGHDERVVLEQVYAFAPGRLLIGSPQRNAKLDLPINKTRVKMNWESDTEEFEKLDQSERKFQLQLGLTFSHDDKDESAPLTMTSSLKPAPLFSFLHHEGSTCVLSNGVWHVQGDGFNLRFDADAGRLIEASIELDSEEQADSKTDKLTIRTQAGAYSSELHKVEAQLAGAKAYDAARPWKSLLAFAFDEWVHGLRQVNAPANKLARAVALQKLAHLWSSSWPSPAKDNDDNEHDFQLPPDKTAFDYADFLANDLHSRQKCVPFVLGVYRKLVPTESWLWPVGRDLILAWTTDSGVLLSSLLKTTHSPEFGPVGALAVSSLTKYTDIKMAAAQAGREHLNATDFLRDCEPLLSGDGRLSQYILSLAEAARSLDEEELRSLADFLPDDAIVRSCGAAMLLTLKEEPEKPVTEALSRMLNVLWKLGLRDTLTGQLQKFNLPEKTLTTVAPASKPSVDDHSLAVKSQLIGTEPPNPASEESASPIHQRVPASSLVGAAAPKPKPNLEKTPDGNDTPVLQQFPGFETGDSFIFPKGSQDSQGKLWYEQGFVPPRPVNPQPWSRDAESTSPGVFTSFNRTTDRPVAAPSDDSAKPTVVATPEKRLGNAALAALQSDDVVATVGGKSILYRDVSPIVKMRLARLSAKAKSGMERQATEAAALDPLTKGVIDQLVLNKMLYLGFERGMPSQLRTDAKKRAEMDRKATKIIRNAFDRSLSAVREKIANASPNEIDNLLRTDATIALLALIMKEQHLESHDELDVALMQFGTTLEQQINAHGEYLMGLEAVRSQFKKKREATENEMQAYYQQHLADYYIPAKARFEILTAKFASFNGDQQAARELASRMADEVLGGKPLTEVARELSQEPRAEEGGFYDWVTCGSLASRAIDQAVFSIDVGVLSKVIEDDIGCHVVRVIARRPSNQLSFLEARTEIQKTIEAQNRKNDQQQYFGDLRAKTPIWTIYDEK